MGPKPKKNVPTNRGIFAPAVDVAKQVMGEQELKEFRASVITKHSKVIAQFVDTSDSKFGQLVLRRMFEYADKDGNGTLDKQVAGILKKADADKNEVIDFEEFVKETPKVLR